MKGLIMILGPNGVGKTKIAYELARKVHGEIINLDRTYLYRGFPITTGLQDTLTEQNVPRHLYEVLESHEASYSIDDFLESVEKTGREILNRGRLAIAEGASTIYVPALLELNSKKKIFEKVIGLRFANNTDIEIKYRLRIDEAFHAGLADELGKNLKKYESSFLIKECHFAVPTIRHLKGEITLLEAKEEILHRCVEYKNRQMGLFSKYQDIHWIEASNTSVNLREICDLIN